MYAGPTNASQGRYSTRVRLGNEGLSFVDEFRYIGHVMAAESRDDKFIEKQCSWQYAGKEVPICTNRGKNSIVQVI